MSPPANHWFRLVHQVQLQLNSQRLRLAGVAGLGRAHQLLVAKGEWHLAAAQERVGQQEVVLIDAEGQQITAFPGNIQLITDIEDAPLMPFAPVHDGLNHWSQQEPVARLLILAQRQCLSSIRNGSRKTKWPGANLATLSSRHHRRSSSPPGNRVYCRISYI